MAATANTISVASGKTASGLQDIFAKVNHVYYSSSAITQSALTTGVECDYEFPVLEDGVTFNTGDVDTTEINLLDGTVWTSKSDKGDSDITFQVSSLNDGIVSLFMSKKTTYNTSVTVMGTDGYKGYGYALDVKKATGSLVMTDDSGETVIILPNVEMVGALVAGDSDNPAYFDVTVSPKTNTAGDSVIILQK